MDRLTLFRKISERNRNWFPSYRPAHEIYIDQLQRLSKPGCVVLHLGAGHDSLDIEKRMINARVVSMDIDWESLSQNKNSMRVLADGNSLPFKGQSFDLVMAENVFEHLEDPVSILRECYRCLVPSGAMIFLCPNRYSYIALVARMTPHKFHQFFRRVTTGVAEGDTFPTYYRCNSPGTIRRIAEQVGFGVETIKTFVGWPTYWEFSNVLHKCFVAVHKLIERLPSSVHISLVGVIRKPRAGC
ncbi:MAG: class I SAM-dependent methyltransferase [Nitrospirota bacterium]